MPTMTEAHRLAQAELAAKSIERTIRLWPLLDPSDLDGTYQQWLRAVTPVVADQHAQSSQLAAGYYSNLRAASVPVGTAAFTPIVSTGVNVELLVTSLLSQGPWKIKTAMSRGLRLDQATELGMVGSARAASRHVLDGGRATIVNSQHRDERAIGYARVGSDHPCGFCAMLISRGPVYPSRSSALQTRDGRRYHDNCSCAAEPVFTDGEWQGRDQYERFSDIWDQSTQGLGGQDAVAAFRQQIDPHAITPGRIATETRRAESAPTLTPSQIADKAGTQTVWANSAGWDTQLDGRRITGTKPDGAQIVWELSDNGAWSVVGRPS